MARAYSLDLRERVVAAVAAGQSCRSVATTFMVSVASVVKWSQRHRAVGSPAALKMGGRRPYLVAREREWVLARIAEKPDLTLRALLKELADRGLIVSYYALWHFLQHEGVTGSVRNLVRGAIIAPMEGDYGDQEGHAGRSFGGPRPEGGVFEGRAVR